MLKIPNKLILQFMKDELLSLLQSNPTTMTILADFTVNYNNFGTVLSGFIDNLPIYTFTDLGLTSTTLDDNFTSTILSNFFIINDEEVSPTYLFGISLNGIKLDVGGILENYVP